MKKNYFTPETKVMTINTNSPIMETELDAASANVEVIVTTDEPLF